ncbi:hypothetical protein FHY29_003131 [Xanthomonas arboricola]|uniref:DUF2357 domain-containing protein n=1 Tax=Xanthomonas arboricola TaxID=56448 RepID=UPI000CEF189F|nr:DUF2357 domain-containing protein [Xanthomonas arboricola]PPU52434.1 hypothetical protein XarbCFBP6827_13295 [Xanthomonas arboricola]
MSSLHIQREDSNQSWQVWPARDSIPPGCISEARSYFFELRDTDHALEADLLVDDVPAEALRSRRSDTARWRWTPGFHAGSVQITLKLYGSGAQRFEITTDPDLRKLTRTNFDAMVREVLEDTLSLFSLSAFRKGIARQPGSRPPPLARLEFLQSRAEAIIDAVSEIGRFPRNFLQSEQITLPFYRANRLTGPEIIRSFRSGVVLKETRTPSRLPQALGGRLPAQITTRRRSNSADIAEHRQIRACLEAWAAWLSSIADMLEGLARKNDPEMISTSGNWSIRSRRIARKLSGIAGAGFLADVGTATATLKMSPLFRSDPRYSRFYRLWQDMNLGLAALFGDFLQMPLARTYELYELWCFLRLLRAAVEEYEPEALDLSSLFITDASGGLTIASGSVSVPIGSGRLVSFQRRYREYWCEPGGEGSFSRTMVPDVVFAGTGFDGPQRQVIVLDAKYRIDDGLNEALNSIHTYRDALVQQTQHDEVDGVVTAAYLLTPYLPILVDDFRKTPVPGRLFHPRYREKFRFGAITLRPGMSGEELRSSLRTIVADASGDF